MRRGFAADMFNHRQRTLALLLAALALPAHAGWARVSWSADSSVTAIRSGCVAAGQYERPLTPINGASAGSTTILGLPDSGRCYFASNAGPTDELFADFTTLASGPTPPGPVRNLTVTAAPNPPQPTTQLVVNFGATAAGNTLGAGWTGAIKDVYTDNRPIGPGGTTIVVGNNSAFNFQGAIGSRAFTAGDKVRATWYNATTASVSFTPRVSMVERGRPTATWASMSAVTIPALGTGATEYAVPPGSYSTVNVNVNFFNAAGVIADKLEVVR